MRRRDLLRGLLGGAACAMLGVTPKAVAPAGLSAAEELALMDSQAKTRVGKFFPIAEYVAASQEILRQYMEDRLLYGDEEALRRLKEAP